MIYSKKFDLKPGDRIIGPLTNLRIAKHHAIYLGWDERGIEWVIENSKFAGVQIVAAHDYFNNVVRIDMIKKFTGNNIARRMAIQKALKLIGKPYHLIDYNCEHFANDIQFAKPESKQVNDFFSQVQTIIGVIAILYFITNLITIKEAK